MEPEELHCACKTPSTPVTSTRWSLCNETDAVMATPDGGFVTGLDAIREQWAGFVALGGRITMETRHAAKVDDLALLRNDWTFVAEGIEVSSRTAEVARRQADGTWRYVIDHPYGGADAATV